MKNRIFLIGPFTPEPCVACRVKLEKVHELHQGRNPNFFATWVLISMPEKRCKNASVCTFLWRSNLCLWGKNHAYKHLEKGSESQRYAHARCKWGTKEGENIYFLKWGPTAHGHIHPTAGVSILNLH